MKNEKMTIMVDGCRGKITMDGPPRAMRKVLALLVRGIAEEYIQTQEAAGRTREEVVEAMLGRIEIAKRHWKMGETDGFKADLRGV